MANFNKVILMGNLTRDPELRYSNSGKAIGKIRIAVNREFKKEGQPDADFFNVVVWGKTAENCANYLKKGRLCAINGNLRNNNYEDKNGVKHYNVEVHANRVEFLEWGERNDQQQQSYQQNQSTYQQPQQQSNNNDFNQFQAVDIDDDILF
jgi:single-strand DNA-binding protein